MKRYSKVLRNIFLHLRSYINQSLVGKVKNLDRLSTRRFPRELSQGLWNFPTSRYLDLKDVAWESKDKEGLVGIANIEPKAVQHLLNSPSDVLIMIMMPLRLFCLML